jgi:TPR repeat protein
MRTPSFVIPVCLCISLAGFAGAPAFAANAIMPVTKAAKLMPLIPGNQAEFNQGAAAFDAGDYDTAYKIFSKLAEDEDLGAMRNVALMQRKGLGTKKDPKAALRLYEYVARAGLPTAQADLAEMLLKGEAGPPDPKAALPWLYLASAASHPMAQFYLGQLFEQGEVVPKDMMRAKLLYAAAAAHGEKRALARLSYLYGWAAPPLDEAAKAQVEGAKAASP